MTGCQKIRHSGGNRGLLLGHLDPERGREPAKRLLFIEEIEGHDDHQTATVLVEVAFAND